ncbi:unnamed protein product, partial [Prorocentrum cordatum]
MSQPSFIKQEVRAKLPQSASAENPDKVEKPKNLKRENLKKEEKPLQDDEESEDDEPEDEGPEGDDPESVHAPALHLLPERSMVDRHESRWRDIFPENAALLLRDWRGIFSEESLPFENAQDMFEGLRQELGLPRPPENTQQHLAENAQQHEAEVEHSGDELEAEAESPKFRGSEIPKEAGSETAELDEEDSRPQELAPEESKRQEQLPEESSREPEVPDDEDSTRQELVPEEVKGQELLPEESERLGENEHARSGMANQVTASKKPAQAARGSKPAVVKRPAQAVSRESKPTVSKKPSRAQIERKASADKFDAVVQVETEVKMETTLKPEGSWSETEIETRLDPAQEAELHASWRAERFNSGELTGPQGDEPQIENAKVLLICVWSDNPMHYTYLKVTEGEFQDVAIECRDSLKVPSESAMEAQQASLCPGHRSAGWFPAAARGGEQPDHAVELCRLGGDGAGIDWDAVIIEGQVVYSRGMGRKSRAEVVRAGSRSRRVGAAHLPGQGRVAERRGRAAVARQGPRARARAGRR